MVTLAHLCPGNAQNGFFDVTLAPQLNLGPAILRVAGTKTDVLETGGKASPGDETGQLFRIVRIVLTPLAPVNPI